MHEVPLHGDRFKLTLGVGDYERTPTGDVWDDNWVHGYRRWPRRAKTWKVDGCGHRKEPNPSASRAGLPVFRPPSPMNPLD